MGISFPQGKGKKSLETVLSEAQAIITSLFSKLSQIVFKSIKIFPRNLRHQIKAFVMAMFSPQGNGGRTPQRWGDHHRVVRL